MSIGTQKVGASSSTRLQPQLTSSSLGLTPVLGTASDVSGIFASVITGLKEMRQYMMEKIDRVEKSAEKGRQKIRHELAGAKFQARSNQAQLRSVPCGELGSSNQRFSSKKQ